MKNFIKKYWPSVVTAATGVVTFLSPSVQAFAADHKAYSIPVLTLWGILLHWAQSPKAQPGSTF
jgi:hypothetical protein